MPAPRAISLPILLLAAPALAVGPSTQLLSNPSVVQMRADDSELAATATGSIVHKLIDTSGNGWLCILTADHVAQAGYTRIGFGNGNPPATSLGGSSSLVFSAAHTGADLALIGVPYGPADSFFDSISPLALAPADPTSRVGTTFSQPAYGSTGTLDTATQRLITLDRAGVQGFQNNTIERTRLFSIPFLSYSYTALEWDFNQPGSIASVPGEGSSFNGDSGAPYLIAAPSPITLDDGSIAHVFSQGIAAVHTYGDSSREHGWLGSGDHIPGGGIAITHDLAAWIDAACTQVPAPASLPLLAAASLFASRRRR